MKRSIDLSNTGDHEIIAAEFGEEAGESAAPSTTVTPTVTRSSAENWYLVETTINSAHKRDLRGSVYDLAARCGGFYSSTDISSIVYNDNQVLVVRVLFNRLADCGRFQNGLESMVRKVFDLDAEIQHNRTYVSVPPPPNPQAIFSSDYQSEDHPDSDDYSVFSDFEDPDAVVVDLSMQPLLWEDADLSCFGGGCPGVRCYLLPRKPYTKYAFDENNFLIMSMENRMRFEGVDNRNPVIAIRWVGDTNRTVTVHSKEYTYCDIAIECRDEEVYRCVGCTVKAEAVRDPVALTYTASVAVPSPTHFRQFLMFKYWETKGLWDSATSADFLARISRVRADVIVKIKQEFSELVIDLDPRQQCKRSIDQVAADH